MIDLSQGLTRATLDPTLGGRITSLCVNGAEVVVGNQFEPNLSNFDWGIYPMVPFAGRIKNGKFDFRGDSYQLELRMPPNAIHGTVDECEWGLLEVSNASAVLESDLGLSWPFRGWANIGSNFRIRH